MVIDEPSVVVPRSLIRELLELVVPEVRRRDDAGRPISPDLRRLLGVDFVTCGRTDHIPTTVPTTYRPPTVEGVSTAVAAQALNVTQRAVVARLHRGTLPGTQLDDGTWLVDLTFQEQPT